MAHDTYTELKYKVTGEIVEVYQTVYGNMRIKDTDGNILTIYGTYDATGKIRYDAMEVKPVAGDTVTIYGPVGQFKDTPQIKNGWIVEHIPAEGTDPEQPPVEPDEPDVPDTPVTGNGVLELTVESLGLDEKVYYTGDATVDGIALDLTQIGNYGDGIQMRDKDGKTSILFNKNALGGKITKIELTYSSTKEVQYANADAVIFSFGAAQDNLSYTTKLSTVVGEKSYTIIPEGDNTFFKIEHDVGFSFYWDSIKIYYEAATTPDEPETSAVLKDGDKIVIYVPAYNKALSMDKVSEGAFYNKGVDVTLTGDVLSGYGEAEIWTVVANEDGTFSFTGKDGKNIGMQDSYATLSQGAVNDDWQLVELDNGTYALKNTVRGNHLQWSTKFNNYSTYTGDPATDDQYQLKFYVVTETTDEPETPPVTPEEPETPPVTPDEPETTTVLKNGDKIVIYVPAYNKALSMDKVSEGSYYNKGVDVTLTGDVLSGYGEAEIWTVVANEDGTFSFTGKDGKNIGMQDSYATLSQGAVNDDWQLVELDNGTYALKNTVRGNHLQWSTKFNNYSTYTGDPATDDQYQLKFYVVAETTDEPETPPVTPEEPETPAEGGYVKVTDAAQLTNGQYVMIVNTGYAPGKLDGSWVSAVQPVVSGNSVTDAAGGVWTLTFNGSSVTITDANGVSIAPKGGNSNGIKSAAYDWAWSFENGAMTFAGVGGDTVVLASNSDAQYGNKFRAYKTSTVGGYPDVYPSEFTLYKLAEK